MQLRSRAFAKSEESASQQPVKPDSVKTDPRESDNNQAMQALTNHVASLTELIERAVKPRQTVTATIQRDASGKMKSITITDAS